VQEVACIASGPDEGRNEGILRKEGQQGILNRPSRKPGKVGDAPGRSGLDVPWTLLSR